MAENHENKLDEFVPWNEITKVSEKRNVYEIDPEFRFGLNVLSIGGQIKWDMICSLGIIVLKPECFYTKKCHRIIDIIIKNDFEILAFQFGNLSISTICSIWRYQLNTASQSRIRILFDILEKRPYLAVLLRKKYQLDVPCTVRVSQLKGSSYPDTRTLNTIRGELAPPNPFLNYVHGCDEPADLVREIAVWFSPTLVEDVLDRDAVHIDLSALYNTITTYQNDIDFGLADPIHALNRIRRSNPHGSSGSKIILSEIASSLSGGHTSLDAREIISFFKRNNLVYARWDLYVLVSSVVELFDQTRQKLVGNINPATLWIE